MPRKAGTPGTRVDKQDPREGAFKGGGGGKRGRIRGSKEFLRRFFSTHWETPATHLLRRERSSILGAGVRQSEEPFLHK